MAGQGGGIPVIADLRDVRLGDRSLHVRPEEKAERDYDIPGTARRRVVAGTHREWLYAYRRDGFDALKPGRVGIAAEPARSRRRWRTRLRPLLFPGIHDLQRLSRS